MNFMQYATGQQWFLISLREGGQRGKLGILGHYGPIFKYPDIIHQKNNY